MKKLIFIWLAAVVCSAVPSPVRALISFNPVCVPGSMRNDPPVESVPTYSYGSDGLVEFHFIFKTEGWPLTGPVGTMTYTHYGLDCTQLFSNGPTFIYGSRIPSHRRVVAHAVLIGPDSYSFALFDEDTGESLPGGFGAMPPAFRGEEAISVGFYSAGFFGTPDPLGSNVSSLSTPAVPVRIEVAPKRTPVLIVPGVMGTELRTEQTLLWPDILRMINPFNSDGFMDPLQFTADLQPSTPDISADLVLRKPAISFDYSQGLIEEFESRGYTEGVDLFSFPYDWRYGVNDLTVEALKSRTDMILDEYGGEKVDIVAHSTGGLIVKKYVQEFPDNHIGKAVMVGVPNLGAPKALKVLLQGDNFGVPGLQDAEMKKLAQNLPVVYDLLPSPKYLAAKGSYVRVEDNFPDFHTDSRDLGKNETEEFIVSDHNLNHEAYDQAQALHSIEYDNFDLGSAGVDAYNLVGCRKGTMGNIVERRDYEGGGFFRSYGAPRFVPGDGTVPLESATNLPVDQSHKYYALKSDHGTMLSQDGIRQTIADLVTGEPSPARPEISQDISQCKLKGKAISIYSPVSIEVTDQSGGRLGFLPDGSIENTIPNADVEVMGDHTFVYLSQDMGEIYGIKLSGTEAGSATIRVDSIDGDIVSSAGEFRQILVTRRWHGQLELSPIETILHQDVDNDGIFELSDSGIIDPHEADPHCQ